MANINRVLHRIRCSGGTISGKKSKFCVPEAVIIGHKCTYSGHLLDDARVQKIKDWPVPTTMMEVHGFLGITGTMRVFIANYMMISKLLVDLT